VHFSLALDDVGGLYNGDGRRERDEFQYFRVQYEDEKVAGYLGPLAEIPPGTIGKGLGAWAT